VSFYEGRSVLQNAHPVIMFYNVACRYSTKFGAGLYTIGDNFLVVSCPSHVPRVSQAYL
jgi:hypothetical protein